MFVIDLRQVGGFLRVIRFPPPIKLTLDITDILLKVALNTIKQTPTSELCAIYILFPLLSDLPLSFSVKKQNKCKNNRLLDNSKKVLHFSQ